MEPDEGMEEEGPSRPWLPPDDRLWRHPSEVSQLTAPTPDPAPAVSRDYERRMWTVALLAGVFGALLASGAGVVAGQYRNTTTIVRPVEQLVNPSSPFVTLGAVPRDDIVDIAARLRPSIVELLVTSNGISGTGSGVIWTSNGYVLTNTHLVDGAQSVVAVLANGHREVCRVVGLDRPTDIAVVKLTESKPADIATFGSSTQLKAGQMAITIGSPVGAPGGQSVTSGIISATNRQVDLGTGIALWDMIQTDARVEQESSGGALVDANGMVVGITTAVGLSDQTTPTYGFATPIEVARDVADQILSTGKVAHTWLGVEGADVDDGTAKGLGISGGAIVSNVDRGSPAWRAGVAPADIVTAVDTQAVNTMSALEMTIRLHRPGDHVNLTFVHDGVVHITEVELAEHPLTGYP